MTRNLGIARRNLALAEQFFAKHATHFEWLPPQAGSIAFLCWLGSGPVEKFCQDALDQQGVMIVPGSIFDFPDNYFRIGLGRKNLNEGLARISLILDD